MATAAHPGTLPPETRCPGNIRRGCRVESSAPAFSDHLHIRCPGSPLEILRAPRWGGTHLKQFVTFVAMASALICVGAM